MLNIIAEITAYLTKRIALYSPIYHSVFPGKSKEEIMVRVEPSPAADSRYLDGSRIGVINFAYYTKSATHETARAQLETIISALDISEMAEIADGISVKVEVITLPAFISKSDSGEYIWSASFRLEFISRRS